MSTVLKLLCLWLCLLFSPRLFAENDSSTLTDPTIESPALRQALATVNRQPVQQAATAAPPVDTALQDPTLMNENFRSALKKMGANPAKSAAPDNSAAVARSPLPDIKVLALANCAQSRQAHAMLSINGKTSMVETGDKFTTLINNIPTHIEVLLVDKRQVKLKIFPNNEVLILQ